VRESAWRGPRSSNFVAGHASPGTHEGTRPLVTGLGVLVRVAHLADLHLGFRAYHRLAAGGINTRERDVALAFRAAVDRLAELKPELLLIAGDVFHSVRPSNAAITDAFRQFLRLRRALGDTPIIMIAGNHDSPRSVESGSILRLFAEIPDVHVVDDEARAIHLAALDTTVLAVPHNALAGGPPPALEPDPAAAVNVLMLHGTVTGGVADEKLRYLAEYGGGRIDVSEIRAERWDYVALGHYHIMVDLAPNMWYAGGIERTASNIWEEANAPKGFLVVDMETGGVSFEPLPTRDVIDLPRLQARDRNGPLEPAMLDDRIRAALDGVEGGVDGKIVRLVIEEITREVFRALDHKRLREYRSRALHLHIDPRRPDVRRTAGSGDPRRRLTLEEELEAFLKAEWDPTSPEIDRPRLVELGSRYMAETPADIGETLLVPEGEG
jgi:DNA repair protein SbcD/Mre11